MVKMMKLEVWPLKLVAVAFRLVNVTMPPKAACTASPPRTHLVLFAAAVTVTFEYGLVVPLLYLSEMVRMGFAINVPPLPDGAVGWVVIANLVATPALRGCVTL